MNRRRKILFWSAIVLLPLATLATEATFSSLLPQNGDQQLGTLQKILKVLNNQISVPSTASKGAGAIDANTLRMTLASDQPSIGVNVTANASTTAAAHTQIVKTVASAGTPVALASSSTKVEGFEIYPRKNDTTANTGAILLGLSSSGGANHRPLLPDVPVTVKSPDGKKVDLSLFYIDAANSGDGVVVTTFN